MSSAPAGDTARSLRAQGEQLVQMGRELMAKAALLEGETPNPSAGLLANAATLALAKEALDARRRRDKFFRMDLFGEPAWDILLDLFTEQEAGRRVSVTAACIGSGAPSATALRYVKLLTEEGLVQREGDPNDGRRSWLTLTPEARDRIREYFAWQLRPADWARLT